MTHGGGYPFPGCCDHGFNTHDRDHCLACACQRPPVQVQQATPVPEQDVPEPFRHLIASLTASGELGRVGVPEQVVAQTVDVISCGVCHALVAAENREAHLLRHEADTATLSALVTVLQDLTNPKGKP